MLRTIIIQYPSILNLKKRNILIQS